jgi:hypothetical protein
LITSAPSPPITIAAPEPILMLSAAPFEELADLIESMSPGFRSVAQSIEPSSPTTMFVPEPSVMSSAPAPPRTTFEPEPVVIVSLAPPSSIVEMRPSVIGRLPTGVPTPSKAAVAEDDARRRAAGDLVRARAADHDRLAVAEADRVVAAVARRRRGDRRDRARVGGLPLDVTVVTDHQARAGALGDRLVGQELAENDRVAAGAAEHDVVAVAGFDDVDAADAVLRRADRAERDRQRVVAVHRLVLRRGDDLAAVTDDHVIAGAAADVVAVAAADDDGVALA